MTNTAAPNHAELTVAEAHLVMQLHSRLCPRHDCPLRRAALTHLVEAGHLHARTPHTDP